MTIESLGGKKWYRDPHGHKDGCNQKERLPIEAGEEGIATEGQISLMERLWIHPHCAVLGEVEK